MKYDPKEMARRARVGWERWKANGKPSRKHNRGSLEEYLLARRRIDKITGCWLWTQSTAGAGYGHFWWDDQFIYAHRAAYEVWKGTIPEGLNICHRCDNPLCINPTHLFPGTQEDNLTDMVEKGRHVSNSDALKRAWKEGRMKATLREHDPLTGRFRSSNAK